MLRRFGRAHPRGMLKMCGAKHLRRMVARFNVVRMLRETALNAVVGMV
jgi:hypothetical protein